MQNQHQPKKSALRRATEFFVSGVVLILGGIFFNATGETCTTLSTGDQFCTENTYYGMSAQTFMIVLFVAAVVCLGVGVLYFRKHQQSQ